MTTRYPESLAPEKDTSEDAVETVVPLRAKTPQIPTVRSGLGRRWQRAFATLEGRKDRAVSSILGVLLMVGVTLSTALILGMSVIG